MLEKLIEEELNKEELNTKFKEIAREKGWRYFNIRFTDVEIAEDKITIKILTE